MSAQISFDLIRTEGKLRTASPRRNLDVRIGYSTTGSILSRIIRFFAPGRATHTFIVFWDPAFAQDMILEAGWLGIVIKSLKAAREDREIVAILRPPQPVDDGLIFAAQWLGERYDYLGLVGMAGVLFWRRFGRRARNWLHSGHALFCSDAAALLMQKGGYQGAESLDPACCDPPALMQWQLDTGSTDVTAEAA
jgi:hypothetical protein